MSRRFRYTIFGLSVVALLVVAIGLASGGHFAVLEPKGTIASQQRTLLLTATGLMLLVVIPVFVLTFYIAWTYRAGNSRARYAPDWDSNRLLESLWWGIPACIILILSLITWRSSHALDPSRPIRSSRPPLTVQVIALPWKWLFIYPEQDIATVNYLELPVGRPVDFQITADAPMNSFWIPQLGGQIYAMPGMVTQLHLMASQTGDFQGSSANISGRGFAAMRFLTSAVAPADFDAWAASIRLSSAKQLDQAAYQVLALPNDQSVLASYSPVQPGLQTAIVNRYMSPQPAGSDQPGYVQPAGLGGFITGQQNHNYGVN